MALCIVKYFECAIVNNNGDTVFFTKSPDIKYKLIDNPDDPQMLQGQAIISIDEYEPTKNLYKA
jgi:hypothetical protein